MSENLQKRNSWRRFAGTVAQEGSLPFGRDVSWARFAAEERVAALAIAILAGVQEKLVK
jgi:hypothetical protein